MSKSPISVVLQSALIAGGTIVGLCHALRGDSGDDKRNSSPDYAAILDRLAALEQRPTEPFTLPATGYVRPDEKVTRLELATSLDRVASDLRREMDSRFSAQDSAIEALRAMTAHTSEMIDRLLERMESSPDFDVEPEEGHTRINSTMVS